MKKVDILYQQAFTLVELLIVVSMVGMLALAVLVAMNPLEQLRKGWDTQRKSDLSQIQKALEIYYQDNGRYPANSSVCVYEIQGDNGDGNDCISWGESWTPYISKMPKDTKGSKHYLYIVDPAGQFYRLYASLERTFDPGMCFTNGTKCTYVPSGITCGGSNDICNYGVSSVNVRP